MKVKKPNHWILDNLDQTEYDMAFEIADTRLVFDSLGKYCIFGDHLNNAHDENEHLQRVIEILELSTIDYSSELSEIESKDKNELYEMYQHLFYLMRVLPVPGNCIEKIKFIYKIIAYSYLGQKWESGRRYIIENEQLCLIQIEDSDTWDIKVFKKVYKAFLHLIRKNNWNDLSVASKLIAELRDEQSIFEKQYLSGIYTQNLMGSSLELVGLYHLAKAVDITTQFMLGGRPIEIREQLDFHFEKAIDAAEKCSNIEMNLILKLLYDTIKQMVINSIWMVTQRVNSRVTKFVNSITHSNKPVYELLYPQRLAVLEKGLLDPAHKAVVVDMPTSSGKTLIAEFRILQALNQFSDDNGWVVYVAPTRALVNQIATRLKRDLSPIDIKVEKMSGAIEIDAFEDNLLKSNSKSFDVLVTTPEKLNLLIREDVESKIKRPLALAVIDEAHNIEDEARGLNLELLMSNIKNDCPRANFLLLTPFIPNSGAVAKWLDPDSPNDISIELNWKPNDRVIGAIYPDGRGRNWKTYFETLLTSNERIKIEKKILVSNDCPLDMARSNLSKTTLTMAVTKQLIERKGILAICRTRDLCWDFATQLANEMDICSPNEDIELVKRFVAAELGNEFSLIPLLDKRIGVHHSGLPDEVKYLMEWLMEKELLKVLVATTTIAQGINFPVSTILMASYAYPWTTEMPVRDFWNLVGRSGRTEQSTLGVVGIAIGEKENNKARELNKLKTFISKSSEQLASRLVYMVEETIKIGEEFDLASQFYKPDWSQFLQYITHMYNQCDELNEFTAKAETFLRRTYGYNYISNDKKKILIDAVKKYASKLNSNKGLAKLSDSTGFSFETINNTVMEVKKLGLGMQSWNSSNLFSKGGSLKNLMGVMLSIPEINKTLKDAMEKGGKSLDRDTLANMTNDWVAGEEIASIASKYFNDNDANVTLSTCCNAIYSKLINSATWGLSSLQKMPNSGLDFDKLSEEDIVKLRNIPAMIYYGVNTDDAILMRINNIPRSIAPEMGRRFKAKKSNIYESTSTEVTDWLRSLPEHDWNNIVQKKQVITGKEYKKVWQILNGEA